MKRTALILNRFVFFLLAVNMLMSCRKQEDIPQVQPLADHSLPSAAVVDAEVKSKNARQLRFSLDVAVFRDSRNIEDRLDQTAFKMDSLFSGSRNYSFTREIFTLRNGQGRAGFSALLLMDQSGSISTTDRNDYRIDAAKAFCSNLGGGDKILLWSFAGNTWKEYGNGFTTDTASVIAQMEGLRDKQGGSTPLYKSQLAAIDYCYTNASGSRAVMTFTDGQNTLSGFKAQDVITRAVSKNIHLYNVGLGDAETDMLCRQALNTGGAFMFARDARQLISMFGNLGKLLDNTAAIYHTEWVINGNRDFQGGTLIHKLLITLPDGYGMEVPFSLDY